MMKAAIDARAVAAHAELAARYEALASNPGLVDQTSGELEARTSA